MLNNLGRQGRRWLAAGVLACAVVVVLLSLTPSPHAAVEFLGGSYATDFGDGPLCGCVGDSKSMLASIVGLGRNYTPWLGQSTGALLVFGLMAPIGFLTWPEPSGRQPIDAGGNPFQSPAVGKWIASLTGVHARRAGFVMLAGLACLSLAQRARVERRLGFEAARCEQELARCDEESNLAAKNAGNARRNARRTLSARPGWASTSRSLLVPRALGPVLALWVTSFARAFSARRRCRSKPRCFRGGTSTGSGPADKPVPSHAGRCLGRAAPLQPGAQSLGVGNLRVG